VHSSRGGAIYNAGSLTLKGVTLQNNTARGVDLSPPYGIGGYALGGAIYSNGALTVEGSIIRNNLAVGGQGAGDRTGGEAGGGGVYVAGGTAMFLGTTITGNVAQGGPGGEVSEDPFDRPPHRRQRPSPGAGTGGGLYIASGALASLDAFTVAHTTANEVFKGAQTKGNKAKSSSNIYSNIYGTYTLLS
jgi:hypothetical protein